MFALLNLLFDIISSALGRKSVCFFKKYSFSSRKRTDNKMTQKSIVTSFLALTQPGPNLPKEVYATAREEYQVIEFTVLSTGLKISTIYLYVQTMFAVLLDSDLWYEIAYAQGISHFLLKLVFGKDNKKITRIKYNKNQHLRNKKKITNSNLFLQSTKTYKNKDTK